MIPVKQDFSDADAAATRELNELTARLNATYEDGFAVNHVDGDNLPRRAEVIGITEQLLEVIFPGFNGCPLWRKSEIGVEISGLLKEIYSSLFDQIGRAIRYSCKTGSCCECGVIKRANHAAFALLDSLPEIRETMKLDV